MQDPVHRIRMAEISGAYIHRQSRRTITQQPRDEAAPPLLQGQRRAVAEKVVLFLQSVQIDTRTDPGEMRIQPGRSGPLRANDEELGLGQGSNHDLE
jgi:hypothetical protein